MARLLDLLRQTPGFAAALYAQGARHHQGILRRRRVEQAFVPQGPCSIFGEGPAVEAQQTGRFWCWVAHRAVPGFQRTAMPGWWQVERRIILTVS
jgi:hypothetical protein